MRKKRNSGYIKVVLIAQSSNPKGLIVIAFQCCRHCCCFFVHSLYTSYHIISLDEKANINHTASTHARTDRRNKTKQKLHHEEWSHLEQYLTSVRKISFQTHYISFGVIDHLALPIPSFTQIDRSDVEEEPPATTTAATTTTTTILR